MYGGIQAGWSPHRHRHRRDDTAGEGERAVLLTRGGRIHTPQVNVHDLCRHRPDGRCESRTRRNQGEVRPSDPRRNREGHEDVSQEGLPHPTRKPVLIRRARAGPGGQSFEEKRAQVPCRHRPQKSSDRPHT